MKAQESYDAVARQYTERFKGELAHKPLDRELLSRFAAEIDATDTHPACDLGCGPGHIAGFLHGLGVPVVGIDLSPRMVEEARALNPDIEFRQGDMAALEVPDGSFSGIACFYSIIHIRREQVTAVLREIRRVLVPDGTLLLTFHIGDEIRHSDEFLGVPVDLDAVFFQPDEMRGYLETAGFNRIEIIERDPYPEVEVQTRRAYIFARK